MPHPVTKCTCCQCCLYTVALGASHEGCIYTGSFTLSMALTTPLGCAVFPSHMETQGHRKGIAPRYPVIKQPTWYSDEEEQPLSLGSSHCGLPSAGPIPRAANPRTPARSQPSICTSDYIPTGHSLVLSPGWQGAHFPVIFLLVGRADAMFLLR